jgi:hypothetical protein
LERLSTRDVADRLTWVKAWIKANAEGGDDVD